MAIIKNPTMVMAGENKLNQLVNGTITTVTEEDLHGATVVKSNLFQGCGYLTSVTLPDTITQIQTAAFEYDSSLVSINIPSGVTTIGNTVFHNCESLTSITIPNATTSVGGYAFQGCIGLTSVTIGTGLTTLPEAIFYNCYHLTSITIPANVNRINGLAFSGCRGLTSITIEATTPPTLINVNAFNNTNNCPIYVPAASVDTYKAATNWSNLASRIEPIIFEGGVYD